MNTIGTVTNSFLDATIVSLLLSICPAPFLWIEGRSPLPHISFPPTRPDERGLQSDLGVGITDFAAARQDIPSSPTSPMSIRTTTSRFPPSPAATVACAACRD
ncbi:hypothetical protein Salat_2416500 [Sesamum alatum]|uniref:Uncharacterized protein n=1 Tax=Sesamum alatum TaxID=300844 RepID=A0AAE2CFA7_9LAMI|nr:hypothetical protein Salat_2416500 [Sesamum alatum]